MAAGKERGTEEPITTKGGPGMGRDSEGRWIYGGGDAGGSAVGSAGAWVRRGAR